MKNKVNITFLVFLILITVLCSFTFYNSEREHVKISLKWYKSYPGEKWENVRTGILWSFANLGARLHKGSMDSAIQFKDSTVFELDLSKLGFSENSLDALDKICSKIKLTHDYQINNYLDLSRFLVLILHSPNNYYRITNAEATFEEFTTKYNFTGVSEFGVTNSSVTKGHRLIKYNEEKDILKVAFVAQEGSGSLFDSTFKSHSFETITVMSNGHFRYAIYNKNGQLVTASQKLSGTGKPSKCMWCHESNYSTLYVANKEVPNKVTNSDFKLKINQVQSLLFQYRKNLNTEIDFEREQDHTQLELLYISFMEPSLFRLKQEFNTLGELRKIQNKSTHIYDEFPFLGNLYHRQMVDRCFTYEKIRVPESVREESKYEPDYFK